MSVTWLRTYKKLSSGHPDSKDCITNCRTPLSVDMLRLEILGASKFNEVTPMRSDRPLIVSILLLASGLGLVFGYGNGTAGFNAAYPVSAASLQLAITTTGPAALGGLILTVLGLLTMAWALICAFVGQVQQIGRPVREIVRVDREPAPVKEYSAREYTPKI
jgi:hypothetical protein